MIYKQLILNVGALLLGFGTINAQAVIPSGGANIIGVRGSTSYSVGQLVYTTNVGSIGSVAQGIQQPFEISVISGLKETEGISLSISVYPNPAVNYVTLKIDNYEFSGLSFQLYNINGKLLENKKIDSNETKIDMDKLSPETYLLKVTKGITEIKTFKVRKN